MGIHGLAKLLGDEAPTSMKEDVIKNYFGRIIAIDASMSLYSFLVAVRMDGATMLTNEAGETTSHLQGMFQRTVRLIENRVKPIYVFDGKPPTLKSGELAKRSKKRAEAAEEEKAAVEEGNKETVEKLAKQSVRVTRTHNDECKKLLRLMGVPVVEAPSEAEAQCAALVKAGKAYATGTEDMDALTFGSPVMVRHLTFSEARKLPIVEINLARILESLKLNMDQFIDLCILCGCDYCDRIKGIGEKRAFELITKYGSLEKVLENLDKEKHPVPPNFPYEDIREIFRKPAVADPNTLELKWEEPDEAGLKAFLVGEKGFSEERVVRAVEKLRGARETAVQRRIDGFFVPQGVTQSESLKRKLAEAESAKGKGKAKGKKDPKLAKKAGAKAGAKGKK